MPYIVPNLVVWSLFLNKPLKDAVNPSKACSIKPYTYVYVSVCTYILNPPVYAGRECFSRFKVSHSKMPNMHRYTKPHRSLENKIHSPLMRMQDKHSSGLYPQFLLFKCVRLPAKKLKLVVHFAACPTVGSSYSCAKGFVSCLINGGDFTVQLFLIRPFSFVPKRF